jgi:hypothetical protein
VRIATSCIVVAHLSPKSPALVILPAEDARISIEGNELLLGSM